MIAPGAPFGMLIAPVQFMFVMTTSPPLTLMVFAVVPSACVFCNSTTPPFTVKEPVKPVFAPLSWSVPTPVFVKLPLPASCAVVRKIFDVAPAPGETSTVPPSAPIVSALPAAKLSCWFAPGLWTKLPPFSVTFVAQFCVAALCAFCKVPSVETVTSPVPRAPTLVATIVPPEISDVPVRALAAPSVRIPLPDFVREFASADSALESVKLFPVVTSTVPPVAPSVSARALVKIPVACKVPPSIVTPFAAAPSPASATTLSVPPVMDTPPVNVFAPKSVTVPAVVFASPPVPARIAVAAPDSTANEAPVKIPVELLISPPFFRLTTPAV